MGSSGHLEYLEALWVRYQSQSMHRGKDSAATVGDAVDSYEVKATKTGPLLSKKPRSIHVRKYLGGGQLMTAATTATATTSAAAAVTTSAAATAAATTSAAATAARGEHWIVNYESNLAAEILDVIYRGFF